MFNIKKKNFKNFDYLLLIVVIALCSFGIFVLRSAQLNLEGNYTRNQIIASALGFIVIIILLFLDIDFLKKLQWPFYFISIALLLVTRLIGTGDDVGARAWINIGGFGFQPSEFVKIIMTMSVASFIDKRKEKINNPLTLLQILIYGGIPIILVLKQPDFGTAMVMAFMFVIMLFASGLHIGYFIGALVAVVASLPFFFSRLDKYQRDRIFNFLNPDNLDASNDQIRHGRIAIGSGGLKGRGYMKGPLSQNGFIPEIQTDYIFSILVEELGFVAGAFLIILYGILLWRMIRIASNAKDTFSSAMIYGYAAMIFIHIFENIGMTIGLMPVTGIPLPLMSYGGTFQLVVLIAIGLSLSVKIQRKPLDFSYKIND